LEPVSWFTNAWMPAMMGEENDVPPAPAQPLGAPEQEAPPLAVSDQQNTYQCPQTPLAANSETSGMSRTPSLGLPTIDCHEGLPYPLHVPLTTPLVDGVPVAQPLGPPLPETTVRRFPPLPLLQTPLEP
jgi:hypothetical protein